MISSGYHRYQLKKVRIIKYHQDIIDIIKISTGYHRYHQDIIDIIRISLDINLHNLKRHSDKIHQASYQVPHIQHYANTIQQYHPNVIPHHSEVKQQGCGLNQAINHVGGAPTSIVVPNMI